MENRHSPTERPNEPGTETDEQTDGCWLTGVKGPCRGGCRGGPGPPGLRTRGRDDRRLVPHQRRRRGWIEHIPSKPHRAQRQKDSNLLLRVERFSIVGYRLQANLRQPLRRERRTRSLRQFVGAKNRPIAVPLLEPTRHPESQQQNTPAETQAPRTSSSPRAEIKDPCPCPQCCAMKGVAGRLCTLLAPQHGLHCERLGPGDVQLNMETAVKGERGGGREGWRARTGSGDAPCLVARD
ncbi:hypothetical protein EYF80_005122 [Liparis tanakae]|uniref:Uncharacterized protein n=1 Tax=Liparis tanakae TaxID=230148 RepID=A0A4Z2J3V9_9TELE|nr:hypothetical protein EYF80_005122 [Liparis tanakae]